MKKRAYDFQKECRIFALVMTIILALIMIAGVLEACGVFDGQEVNVWKPTESYPMANAKISWNQTYYPGPLGVGDNGI